MKSSLTLKIPARNSFYRVFYNNEKSASYDALFLHLKVLDFLSGNDIIFLETKGGKSYEFSFER